MGSYRYTRSQPYQPGQVNPFKLSRSKIDLYTQCPRCFYLETRLGIKRPSIPGFTLNMAVDHLLKLEFDTIRQKGGQHPLQTKYGVDAKPVAHDNLNVWRENFQGVQTLHEPTNLLITGAIDDLWQDSSGNYIVVDYKATSKNGTLDKLDDTRWHDQYRRQIEIYQWLLRQFGLKVSNTGYFVYCNAMKNKKGFDAKLEFEITLIPHQGNDSWIEPILNKIKQTLEGACPKEAEDCEHCSYARSRTQMTLDKINLPKIEEPKNEKPKTGIKKPKNTVLFE